MRSLFWKIFLAFWLTIALIAVLTFMLGRWLTEEQWLLKHYPGLDNYAAEWTAHYQQGGLPAAEEFSRERLCRYGVRVSVQASNGQQIYTLIPPRRSMSRGMGMHGHDQPPVSIHRLSADYTTADGQSYLFNYAIPDPALQAWRGHTLRWPMLLLAVFAISLVSWLLSAYIVRPVNRLRAAVDELGQGRYQSAQLARIGTRRDELGLLARDFNQMGERLQNLLTSQRQLLRDVSHELRSPLTRLRIGLGLGLDLAEREVENGPHQPETWQKLEDWTA